MDYENIKKLNAFFSALKDSGFKSNLNQISSFTIIDGQRTPVDKDYCLNLLRKFPQFQGDEFKDDNAIIKYLSDPRNRANFLGKFSQQQRQEFEKYLEVKPTTAEGTTEQFGEGETPSAGQEAQPTTAGEPASTMTGGSYMPVLPSTSPTGVPRVIHNVPQAPEIPKETEAGESKLFVANKGGKVVEERSITPTSSTIKKSEEPSKLFIANKSGTVVGERVIGKLGSEIGSSAQIGVRKGITRMGTNLSGIGGGIGRGLGGLLQGAAGGGGRFIGRVGLFGADSLVSFSNQISFGTYLKGPSKKWLLFLLLFLIFFVGILSFLAPTELKPYIAPEENISTCTFYRGGDKKPDGTGTDGLQFRIATWPTLINEVAFKVGVPASILAGLLRVECGNCFYSDNPEYITNDYDAHFSCDVNSPPGTCIPFAYGVMQFYPPTFEGVFNRNKDEMASLFGKTSVTTTIDDQDAMASPDVLRIYSIRDSVIAAAFKVRNDVGTDPPYDHSAIERIVTSYFTQCEYIQNGGTYNYCVDLWRSYSECRSKGSMGTIADASCPIEGGKIGCASYGLPYDGARFSGACRPDSTGNGGHCNENYIAAVGICTTPVDSAGNLIRTAKSIDVANNTKPGDSVYLPDINGEKIKWKYIGAVSAGSNFGWIRLFQSVDTPEGIWSLHLVHVDNDLNPTDPPMKAGDVVESGNIGARILEPWIPGDPWPHVHITIGLDVGDSVSDLKDYSPNWKFPDRELGMCTK